MKAFLFTQKIDVAMMTVIRRRTVKHLSHAGYPGTQYKKTSFPIKVFFWGGGSKL